MQHNYSMTAQRMDTYLRKAEQREDKLITQDINYKNKALSGISSYRATKTSISCKF